MYLWGGRWSPLLTPLPSWRSPCNRFLIAPGSPRWFGTPVGLQLLWLLWLLQDPYSARCLVSPGLKDTMFSWKIFSSSKLRSRQSSGSCRPGFSRKLLHRHRGDQHSFRPAYNFGLWSSKLESWSSPSSLKFLLGCSLSSAAYSVCFFKLIFTGV